ncbi:MAG TPA: response regulator transcription factor [Bryobacteraceae bacterium]|nr:response regulator transcription factor [Bryobacteraceae bacterium]
MARIGLYTDREVIAVGLERILHPDHRLEVFALDFLALTLPVLQGKSAPEALIVDAPPEAARTIEQICAVDRHIPVVYWERDTASEPALNALGSGVQGVLLDTTPAQDILACIETVSKSGVWVPPSIAQAVVSTRQCRLTRREGQLMNLVAQGLRNKEIASKLGICEGTVKVYLSRLFDKLEVSDRFELALLALRQGVSLAPAPQRASVRVDEDARPRSVFLPKTHDRWTPGPHAPHAL